MKSNRLSGIISAIITAAFVCTFCAVPVGALCFGNSTDLSSFIRYGTSESCTSGNCTKSNCSTGNCSTGNCSTGNCSTGNCSTGNCSTGNCSTGNCSTGNCSTGNCSTGNCSTGNCSTGNCSTGNCSTGNCSTGNCSTGNCSTVTNSSDYMSYIVSLMNKRNTSSNQAAKKCSISSDKNSISITEGNSDSVMLSLSGSCKISAYTDTKGIVSISKGSCQNGKINVTFKGISAGSVNVKFVPSCDKSVYCTVNVTVNSVNEDIEEDITDNSSSCTDGSCGTVNPSTDTSSSSSCSEYASQVLYYVNEARKDEGLSPLSLDANLCSAANLRAQEISSYFSHTRPNGSSWSTVYSEFGCKYSYSGENIAAGNSTAKATVDQWLASPGHRANILNKNYTKLGVGYFYSANSDYGYYWAQDFGG